MVPEGLALVLNFLEIPASSWHSRTTVSKTVSPDGIPPATWSWKQRVYVC